MIEPGRKFVQSAKKYRYSINGQEKETELNENITTAEYWMYDSRIGKRWNIDPVAKLWESPYACFGNNPILLADPSGADAEDPKGKTLDNVTVKCKPMSAKRRTAIETRMKRDNISFSEAAGDFDKKGNEKKATSGGGITNLTKINYTKNEIVRISNNMLHSSLKASAYVLGGGLILITGGTAAPALIGGGGGAVATLKVSSDAAIVGAAHLYRYYWMYGPSAAYLTNNYLVPFLDESGGNAGLSQVEGRVFDVVKGHMSRLAAQAAKGFRILQCTDAADAIVKTLKSEGFGGTIINLQSTLPNGQKSLLGIWSNKVGDVISENGFHTGVLVEGKVFDNIHTDGIDYNSWIKDFSSTISTTLKETRINF